MKRVRNNVFETNSSSTHSLTIGNTTVDQYVPYGNKIKIRWINTDDERILSSLEDKISYLVSHIASWYKYNEIKYEDLIDNIKNDYNFKKIQDYVETKFQKEIVFPKYNGDIEDVININHQLSSYHSEHDIDEIIKDMMDYDRHYLDEYLRETVKVEFGRD